ncbi:unnamed protein product [Dovyalis caffra]|uniref:PCI domain-containing protein n=1 Tax=Dovyalis caffra TaxID=77055 RepID=A0AAV1SUR0_9ROSI|nr:unnamed protein product [Dovyalis caffra]
MEIEEGQAQAIEQFVDNASTLDTTSSLANLIVDATSHPSLFAFSEILSLPNLLQLQGTEDSAYLDLLRLFAYGTWRDYKSNSGMLPKLLPDQILKLKQLTVLTLSETNKDKLLLLVIVLSYDKLLEELEVSNVRELEDFLINECMYVGIVKGKLNQLGRCFEVQFAAGRDLMHGQLGSMIDTLGNWLATSDNMLPLIEEQIDWASKMCQLDMDHQQELQGRIDEAKTKIHFKKSQYKQGLCFWENGDNFDCLGEAMAHEDDLLRSKRNAEWAGTTAYAYARTFDPTSYGIHGAITGNLRGLLDDFSHIST